MVSELLVLPHGVDVAVQLFSAVRSIWKEVEQKATNQECEERLAAIEGRIEEVAFTLSGARRIRGLAVDVLSCAFRRELGALWEYAGVDDILGECLLDAGRLRKVAEELVELELVHADRDLNNECGFVRLRLADTAYYRAGHAFAGLRPRVSCLRTLAAVRELGGEDDRIVAEEAVALTGLAVPEFDLATRALVGLDLLKGLGTGGDGWGRHFCLEVTPLGRRVLRGDDSF